MSFGLLKDFLETTEEERVEVLYRYLVKGETGSYIAEDLYRNKNYAWKVSAITQGYNETGGKNRGKVNTNKETILIFVKSYPKGTYETGVTLLEFLDTPVKSILNKSYNKDMLNSKNSFVYSKHNTTAGVDEVLKYIYSNGLGFPSEYKYSLVLEGDIEKKVSKNEWERKETHVSFVAVFEDYLVYILGALDGSSVDLLIPFKEIKEFKIVDKSFLEVDVLYHGKTDLGHHYRVTMQFSNKYEVRAHRELFEALVDQYKKWNLEGRTNYSSQLPMIRDQHGINTNLFIGDILYNFLHEGQTVNSIAESIFDGQPKGYGVRAIAKLLFFDFRLKLSDRGKLSEFSFTKSDYRNVVIHFKNGIRVDKDEMSSAQPSQNGIYVIERFLTDK
ncbi:hypothetical protein [Streptococcus salivarius]|uniref:hypothetical protein n=1 Tax=Streptococcus salivarius TaxID=1304 RepID=UPI00093F835F|nr:hypothetical protein [Streptococcus salivarius]